MRFLGIFVAVFAVSSVQADFLGEIGSVLTQVITLFDHYEEVPYEVTRTETGYEERQYPAQKWVCTQEESSTNDVNEAMFWRLFSYIQGANNREANIAMTVPVSTEYRVLGADQKVFQMCFYLGQVHQSNPPEPNDSSVVIQSRPTMTVLTRTVGGYIETEEEWTNEAGKLAAIVTRNGESVTLNHHYWVGYDAPVKFWNRRNEVWFPQN